MKDDELTFKVSFFSFSKNIILYHKIRKWQGDYYLRKMKKMTNKFFGV